jgi:hypothetical protein
LCFEFSFQCMKRFIRQTDPYKVQQKLLCALDKCGRRDLKEDVEEILNRRAWGRCYIVPLYQECGSSFKHEYIFHSIYIMEILVTRAAEKQYKFVASNEPFAYGLAVYIIQICYGTQH